MSAPFQFDFRPFRYFRYRGYGQALGRFREAFTTYLSEQSSESRTHVNETTPAASEAIARLGMTASSVDPLTGVVARRVNLIQEALNERTLRAMGASQRMVLDNAEQGIAAYAEKTRSAKWQLVNPLVWLWSAIELLLRTPFLLLAAAGVSTGVLERSTLGQLLKVVEMLLAIFGALKKLGWI